MTDSSLSSNTSQIRRLLNKTFNDSELEAFCFDYYGEVYNRFTRGLLKDEKITQLLQYCRRKPGGMIALLEAVRIASPEFVYKEWDELLRKESGKSDQAKWNLRHPTPHFVNREQELNILLELLQNPGQVIGIIGPPGIGKSELVWKALSELDRNLYPDGCYWYECDNQRFDENLRREIYETLSRDSSYDMEAFRSPTKKLSDLLYNKHALLFIDGLDEINEVEDIIKYRGEQCTILLTCNSKKGTALLINHTIELQPLPAKESVKLLRTLAKTFITNQHTAYKLSEMVNHLPLAIQLIGAYLKENEITDKTYLSDFLKVYERTDKDPSELVNGPKWYKFLKKLELIVDRSVQKLDNQTKQILVIASQLAAAPFSREVIYAGMEKIPDTTVIDGVGRLVTLYLLRKHGISGPVDVYSIYHRAIYDYVGENLVLEIDPKNSITRIGQYYIDKIPKFSPESASNSFVYSLFERERPHIMAIIEKARSREIWRLVFDLSLAIDEYLDWYGFWPDREVALLRLLEAQRQIGQGKEEIIVFTGRLGSLYRKQGKLIEAEESFSKALELSHQLEINHPNKEQFVRDHDINRANVLSERAQWQEARQIYLQYVDLKNSSELARILNSLARTYFEEKELNTALEYYRLTHLLAKENNDEEQAIISLGNIGKTYDRLFRETKDKEMFDKATSTYMEVYEIALKLKNLPIEKDIGKRLAMLYLLQMMSEVEPSRPETERYMKYL